MSEVISVDIKSARANLKVGRIDAALIDLKTDGYFPINPQSETVIREIASIFNVPPPRFHNGKKLRVGYITESFYPLQAPVKRLLYLSEYHDKDAVEMHVFSRFGGNDKTRIQLAENGCIVTTSPAYCALDRTLWLFEQIRAQKLMFWLHRL